MEDERDDRADASDVKTKMARLRSMQKGRRNKHAKGRHKKSRRPRTRAL